MQSQPLSREQLLSRMRSQKLADLVLKMFEDLRENNITATNVVFFAKIFGLLVENRDGVSCADMASAYREDVSKEAARKHVRRLEKAGYLKREGYRRWALDVDGITRNTIG